MNAAVVYWSGTGNTEAMAQAVAEGIQAAGGTAEVCEVGQTDADTISKFDKIALGCPSMGAEQLEDSEMEPFVEELEPMISGKQLLLFGSYGWGDGQWMRDWEERVKNSGAAVIGEEGIIVNGAPDVKAEEKCKELGRALAAAVS